VNIQTGNTIVHHIHGQSSFASAASVGTSQKEL
jgi:hypothetical protein